MPNPTKRNIYNSKGDLIEAWVSREEYDNLKKEYDKLDRKFNRVLNWFRNLQERSAKEESNV